MKKLYTFSLAIGTALAVSTAFAAEPQAQKTSVSDASVQKVAFEELSLQKTTKANAPFKAEGETEGTWVKKSTGIWFEGPLATRFSDVEEGQWDVDIYENEAKPGWIRLNPYTENTPPAQLLGRANENYLDICVSDPEKCYFLDWKAFGSFTFGSYCPENEWTSGTGYGTLKDGTITFAPKSVVYGTSDGWYMLNGEIKVVLDKSTYVDYTVTASAPFCTTADEQYFEFTKTDAITTVKLAALNGYYPMSDANAAVVKAQGVDITSYAGKKVNFGLDAARATNSYLYVGLDAAGEIRAKGAVYSYILDAEADKWKELGEATYTEGILCLLFSDVESEDLKCKIEENIETPGYFRLVNPYANHTQGFNASHTHNHYIYINATDADHVYVEPSVTGAYVPGFGTFACESWGYQYLDRVAEGETAGIWGKYAENKITVPQFRAQISDYNNAEMMNLYDSESPSSFAVTLPSRAGINDIISDDAQAAPVYYNLQGVRVANPENGMFIEVRGNKAVKVVK